MAEDGKATWQDVSDALANLETRQASLRSQLAAVQHRARWTNKESETKLKLNFAARLVQLQRQSQVLRSQSIRACRQVARSRSIAVKAKEAEAVAQVESQQLRCAVEGLGDALDAKTREAETFRCECEDLRRRLQLQERRTLANDLRLQQQEDLLEEAAVALGGFISHRSSGDRSRTEDSILA